MTIEKHVEIGRLELSSYPVRDAHPPSQFIEMASLGDRDNRANSVSFVILVIS